VTRQTVTIVPCAAQRFDGWPVLIFASTWRARSSEGSRASAC
jgi:hypothetical protein